MSDAPKLDKYKAEMSRARDLGFDYSEIRSTILSVHDDGPDGISEGRAVEIIREIGLRAVDKAVAEERASILEFLRNEPETLRECNGHRHKNGEKCLVMVPMTLEEIADAIERGDYPKGKGA